MKAFTRAKKGASAPFPPDQHQRLMRAIRDIYESRNDQPMTDHEFLPVNGHPDDDECTYREDGTDATYCGEPKEAHGTDLLSISLALTARDADVALVQIQELLEHPSPKPALSWPSNCATSSRKPPSSPSPRSPSSSATQKPQPSPASPAVVSRQLAEQPAFPPALVRTAQGPLYAKSAVETWAATRNRATGRRPAAAS